MPINTFIAQQVPERLAILLAIHEIIVATDKTVTATIGTMMRKEMILYNAANTFKYGLSSVKNHISLHLMPIYCSPALHQKYQDLLPAASFQKGCINFKNAAEMPLPIVQQLFEDCAIIDLKKILEDYKSKKK
jgi:hypothetical protein